ncbi:hypothetical protein [Streptomyces sp. NPDC019890]|uniref:hypothetical protein n=1 Tax=Streptomyces sp. NPDC019890 TaxID=3365064 RepID=UPI00384F4B82
MTVQENTTLKVAYAGKVAADLAENTAEQDRIRAEIETLQTQLATLENDHALLESVSAALGDTTGAVPAPRRATKKTAAVAKKPAAKKPAAKKPADAVAPKKAGAKKEATKKATTVAAKKTAATTGGAKEANTGADKGPALTELIHAHLSSQSEPRTAREIAKALADANPGRNVNDNLVRTTTERLVARSRVDRVKQGSTVYYTAKADAAPAASGLADKATVAAS